MALSDPIPVRFSEAADDGLSSVAGRAGVSKAELIRIAVTEFLIRVAETGEIVQRIPVRGFILPPNLDSHGQYQHQAQGEELKAAEDPPTQAKDVADEPRKSVRYLRKKP